MTRIAFLLLYVLIAKSHLLTLRCLKPHQYILLNNGGANDSLSLLRRKRLGGVSLFFAPPIVLKIRLEPEPNAQQQDLARPCSLHKFQDMSRNWKKSGEYRRM
jgi:hypothetical protein